MADENDNEHCNRSFPDVARSILDHGINYTEARIELAKLEADEAADHLRSLSKRLGFGAFAATTGYAICLSAGIALVARHQAGGHWEIPALIVGGLHLAVGALFLVGARRQAKLSADLFHSTRNELIKDQLWLKKPPPADSPADAAH
jgi:uncharacterized membrane protein YqjE